MEFVEIAEYRRRTPEQTVLHEVVRENLNTFLAEAEETGCARRGTRRKEGEEPPGRRRRWKKRKDWATVMRQTLGLDVLSCPECSGRMRACPP